MHRGVKGQLYLGDITVFFLVFWVIQIFTIKKHVCSKKLVKVFNKANNLTVRHK